MTRSLAFPALLVYVVFFPVLMPFRLAWGWFQVREEIRSLPWSRLNLEKAVHETTLMVWPPLAAFTVWALYQASEWGPGGAGGEIRGAVLGWLGAALVVLAVVGARNGEVADETLAAAVPQHPVRHLLRYAAVFGSLVLAGMALVLVPVALILSI